MPSSLMTVYFPCLVSIEDMKINLPVSILIVVTYSQQSINVKLNPLSSVGKEPDNNILFLLPKRILIVNHSAI